MNKQDRGHDATDKDEASNEPGYALQNQMDPDPDPDQASLDHPSLTCADENRHGHTKSTQHLDQRKAQTHMQNKSDRRYGDGDQRQTEIDQTQKACRKPKRTYIKRTDANSAIKRTETETGLKHTIQHTGCDSESKHKKDRSN